MRLLISEVEQRELEGSWGNKRYRQRKSQQRGGRSHVEVVMRIGQQGRGRGIWQAGLQSVFPR